MFQNERQFLEAAMAMGDPLVVAYASKGSAQATFILIDGDLKQLPKTYETELPRSLFNGLRDNGTLYCNVETPLKINGHRAWFIRIEEEISDGGKESEAV